MSAISHTPTRSWSEVIHRMPNLWDILWQCTYKAFFSHGIWDTPNQVPISTLHLNLLDSEKNLKVLQRNKTIFDFLNNISNWSEFVSLIYNKGKPRIGFDTRYIYKLAILFTPNNAGISSELKKNFLFLKTWICKFSKGKKFQ